jgi:hypothetical protein
MDTLLSPPPPQPSDDKFFRVQQLAPFDYAMRMPQLADRLVF